MADIHALMLALNEIAQVISPMTLADLKFGRDPFDSRNQITSKKLQFCLTLFALIVLTLIGYFMQSLRQEQSAIATLRGATRRFQPGSVSTLRIGISNGLRH
jgi:hypothetical protein